MKNRLNKIILATSILSTNIALADLSFQINLYGLKDGLKIDSKNQNGNTATIRSSCKEILDNNEGDNDGVYTININGSEKEVYCDMTTSGGGWTLISHIYDRDNRDDILNNSNGSEWGDSGVGPTHDSSFNIAIADTPSFTESVFEWDFPSIGDNYKHDGNALVGNRFNWSSPNPSQVIQQWSPSMLGITTGRISGVFGHTAYNGYLTYLNENHQCGGGLSLNKALHYWGYGAVIAYGNDTGAELHSIPSGQGDRAINLYCGTRNTILNIWIR